MSVDVAPLSVFVLSIGVPNRLEKHTGSLQSGTCVTLHNDPVNQCYTHTSIVFTTSSTCQQKMEEFRKNMVEEQEQQEQEHILPYPSS